jgi:hypothetical protein
MNGRVKAVVRRVAGREGGVSTVGNNLDCRICHTIEVKAGKHWIRRFENIILIYDNKKQLSDDVTYDRQRLPVVVKIASAAWWTTRLVASLVSSMTLCV